MKNVWRVLTRSVMSALAAAPLFAPTASAANPPMTRSWVALGDSISYGYNLGDNTSGPSPQAFPYLTAKAFHKQAVDVAVPGWTSSDLLRALQTKSFSSNLTSAAVVSIDIGSNDLLNALGTFQQVPAGTSVQLTTKQKQQIQLSLTTLQKNLPAIIAAVRVHTRAPIVLATLYNPFPDNSPVHLPAEAAIALANDLIRNTAAQTGCLVADAYLAINHRQMTLVRVPDQDIHPTASGQSALASAFEAAVSQPLDHIPTYYACAPRGVVVRTAPSGVSGGLHWLHGIEADPVTGAAGSWLKVGTPSGANGYVPRASVQLLLRPWNDVSFRTTSAYVTPVTLTSSAFRTTGFLWNHTAYAPVSALARAAGLSVTWNNLNRAVEVTSNSSFDASLSSPSTQGAGHVAMRMTPLPGGRVVNFRTEGILIEVDGEPVRLAGEPVMADGNVDVPVVSFWNALGLSVKDDAHGLQLLSGAGS